MWKGEAEFYFGNIITFFVIIIVAIGVFSSLAKVNATNFECKHDLRQAGVLLKSYARQHNGTYPTRTQLITLLKAKDKDNIINKSAYEYHYPQKNAPSDFLIIKLKRSSGLFTRGASFELHLNGAVHSE